MNSDLTSSKTIFQNQVTRFMNFQIFSCYIFIFFFSPYLSSLFLSSCRCLFKIDDIFQNLSKIKSKEKKAFSFFFG